ncbi:MAG: glucuronate isomerase [Eubacteriales bacterium]|nr:glucuronate isomerase [Eubacteriales bacterium]
MKTFINEDFLLQNKMARRLYHDYAENTPIFDYHCHLNPQEIYDDTRFTDLAHAWLGGDHYKWRVLRAAGVPEEYVTGSAPGREKFDRFAAVMPGLIGNPIYHWSHLELKRFFDVDELLDPATADEIWAKANEKLQSPAGSARSLIRESNVRALCTTDDPVDSLEWHKKLAADTSFAVKVLPTFRPEKAMNVTDLGYPAYLQKLGAAANLYIRTLDDVKQALAARMEYFAACGCRLSDHSFGSPDFTVWDESAAEQAVHKALTGEPLLDYEAMAYQSAVMDFLGGLYAEKGFTMQLHLGAIRNLHTKRFRALGADIGCDSIGDPIPAASLAALLDRLAARDALPQTILYTLNAADNDKLSAAAGCFQDGPGAGKIQFGSAWWFNDHFDGMTAQLKSLANIGVLSHFIGMLTDSRSFLSYPRHEYFRRILCRLFGEWVEQGMAPGDDKLLGGIVRDICYGNVVRYIGLED